MFTLLQASSLYHATGELVAIHATPFQRDKLGIVVGTTQDQLNVNVYWVWTAFGCNWRMAGPFFNSELRRVTG